MPGRIIGRGSGLPVGAGFFFLNYNDRLGAKDIEFAKMVPGLWLAQSSLQELG